MTSEDFTYWIAWYRITDGRVEERPPTPDELGAKLAAFAATHNARAAVRK